MTSTSSNRKPKLRALEPQRVQYLGRPFIHLRDPLGLTDKAVLLPEGLAPILALADGTRDEAGLQASLLLLAGVHVSQEQVRELVAGMDEACLLESDTYRAAVAAALSKYHAADARPASHADAVYPSKRGKLAAALDGYEREAPSVEPLPASANLTGVVSPHIDYQRGGKTYAQLWRRCSSALGEVELVVILGTDHAGSPGALTLTRQSYATPFGTLPTEREVVDGLAGVIGERRAFEEEIHHLSEHSIELAAVWLHKHIGRDAPVAPVLCGSFHPFVTGEREIEDDGPLNDAVEYLQGVMAGRRTLVIAAGDLAHVGPAFGDPAPVDVAGRSRLAAEDARTIEAINAADPRGFLALSAGERDRRKICGLPPIYLALRLLEGSKGESMGYAQSPADARGGSLVSIVGSALTNDTGAAWA